MQINEKALYICDKCKGVWGGHRLTKDWANGKVYCPAHDCFGGQMSLLTKRAADFWYVVDEIANSRVCKSKMVARSASR